MLTVHILNKLKAQPNCTIMGVGPSLKKMINLLYWVLILILIWGGFSSVCSYPKFCVLEESAEGEYGADLEDRGESCRTEYHQVRAFFDVGDSVLC